MAPREGEPAPDFALPDQHGQEVSLADWRGIKNVVVVFYPFAFSRVCTGELGELRDSLGTLTGPDRALVAISCDSMYTLRAFADSEGLSFPVLSDFWPHGRVAAAYGVFDEARGPPRRAPFVLDRQGLVQWRVENSLPQARNLAEYADALARLG